MREISNQENDLSIVKTIISMAKTLKLHVVAEGVETQEQLDILKKNGCETFQGYLFSEPLTKEQFIKYISEEYSEVKFKNIL